MNNNKVTNNKVEMNINLMLTSLQLDSDINEDSYITPNLYKTYTNEIIDNRVGINGSYYSN
jgi:hypothetical protein